MSTSAILKVVVLVTCALQVNGDYYWRPWTPGQAAKDAVTGRDYRGVSYIVEATVPGSGVYIGQAFLGQSYVNVTARNLTNVINTVTLTSGSLKVLCSSELDTLAWYPTYYSSLTNELVTATITPVLGGVSAANDLIYIGRFVQYNTMKTVHFGSVISADNQLYYNYNNFRYKLGYYELLIVNTHCSDKQ